MMEVVAMKLTTDIFSAKVVYKKDGRLYLRSGKDGFTSGEPLQTTLSGVMAKWGFRKVANPPTFRDGNELKQNITNFAMNSDGTIQFSRGIFIQG
jgi:hypothetical protein